MKFLKRVLSLAFALAIVAVCCCAPVSAASVNSSDSTNAVIEFHNGSWRLVHTWGTLPPPSTRSMTTWRECDSYVGIPNTKSAWNCTCTYAESEDDNGKMVKVAFTISYRGPDEPDYHPINNATYRFEIGGKTSFNGSYNLVGGGTLLGHFTAVDYTGQLFDFSGKLSAGT